MATVKLHIQDPTKNAHGRCFNEDWGIVRNVSHIYRTPLLSPESILSQAFKITNAPEELLEEVEKDMIRGYRGPSLSVGDMVEVDGKRFLVARDGFWEAGVARMALVK